jgi:hypothetical protein
LGGLKKTDFALFALLCYFMLYTAIFLQIFRQPGGQASRQTAGIPKVLPTEKTAERLRLENRPFARFFEMLRILRFSVEFVREAEISKQRQCSEKTLSQFLCPYCSKIMIWKIMIAFLINP